MANANQVTAIAGFQEINEGPGTTSYYQAASAGAMNAQAADGSFAAFVTFWIESGWRDFADGGPNGMFLWGTLDGAGGGWALHITTDAQGVGYLTAEVGSGELVSSPITWDAVTPSGGTSGVVERLIMAGLWYDGSAQRLALSVNGNVAGAVDVPAFVPSALAARLGFSPTGAALPATWCDVLGCGYYNAAPLAALGSASAPGLAFRSQREAYGPAILLPDNSRDWTHRYDARSLAPGAAPIAAAITKVAGGVAVSAPAPVADDLPDLGQSGAVDTQTFADVALSLVGTDLYLPSQKNADWFSGGATTFTLPVIP